MFPIQISSPCWTAASLVLSFWLWVNVVHASQLPADVEAAFQELDRLSPPEIWNKPIVRLELATKSDAKKKPPVRSFLSGLLIGNTDQLVSIWDPSLEPMAFAKMPLGEDEATYVVSIKTVTLDEQIQLFKMDSIEKQKRWEFLGPDELEPLFWGRVAHALGEFDAREQLLKTVKLRLGQSTLGELLERQIPISKHERITWHLENSKNTRSAVLKELDDYLLRFPKSPTFEKAKELRDNLQSLITEESLRATEINSQPPTKEKAVKALIFRLCDVSDASLIVLRFPIFALEPKYDLHASDPCWQLFRMGWDAVPDLIEAMSDPRPTRIKDDSSRIIRVNLRFITIGEMAESLLNRISGGEVETSDKAVSVRQAAYRAWYEDVQKVGRQSYLLNKVSQGGKSVEWQLVQLVEMVPESALEAIKQAIPRTEDKQSRDVLYFAAKKLGDQATEYLVGQLESERELYLQLSLAHWLREKKQSIADEFILKKFEEYRSLEFEYKSKVNSDGNYAREIASLASYLVSTNRMDSLLAIEKSFGSLPVAARRSVVQAMQRDAEGISTDVLETMERILAKGLADPERDDVGNAVGARVCVASAIALSRLFPTKHHLHAIKSSSQSNGALTQGLSQVIGVVEIGDAFRRENEELASLLETLRGNRMTSESLSKVLSELLQTKWNVGHVMIEFCNCNPSLGFALKATCDNTIIGRQQLKRFEIESVASKRKLHIGLSEIQEFADFLDQELAKADEAPLHVMIVLGK